MKRLCTGSKTGGICYEHEVLWIGRRRLLRTELIILIIHVIDYTNRTTRYSRDHSYKRSYAPPPSPTDFFNGEHSLHSTLCVEKLSASLSLSSVPFIRFWFYFFYMNNMKSQKLKVFWICKRLFLVLQKSLKRFVMFIYAKVKLYFIMSFHELHLRLL